MKFLRLLRSFLAYLLAFTAIPLVMAMFLGMEGLASALINTTGVTVSPLYTGGEVVREVPHGTWTTHIHKPVFESLVGPPAQGFVQIDWTPKKAVPTRLHEDIDYNGDGKVDFSIDWTCPTGVPRLTAASPEVLGILEYYELAERYAVRISLASHK